MRRLLPTLLLLMLALPEMAAQSVLQSVLGYPDRLMSGTAIGRVSQKKTAALPEWDYSRVDFAPDGTRPISADFDFTQHLFDNDLTLDAQTLLMGSYAPSDTLSYLRARLLFDSRKLQQASELFADIPLSSVAYGNEAYYYRMVSLTHLGDYAAAKALLPGAPAEFASLTALEGAGLALLQDDKAEWARWKADFSEENYHLAEGQQVLSSIAVNRFERSRKSPLLAGFLSAVIPGTGKIYAGRVGEGVSAFLTVGTLGAITGEQWYKHGFKDWRTLVAGSLCAVFYLGNIYGSYMSVSIENDERIASDNLLILYHLHIPLRSIFR